MIKLLIRIALNVLVNAIAIWAATLIVPGLRVTGGLVDWLIVGVVFGLVNALIRPIVKLLTLPLTVVTLGLFTLVVNAVMLMLTSWLLNTMVLEGAFFGFIPALLGSIVISIVSIVLNWIIPD